MPRFKLVAQAAEVVGTGTVVESSIGKGSDVGAAELMTTVVVVGAAEVVAAAEEVGAALLMTVETEAGTLVTVPQPGLPTLDEY